MSHCLQYNISNQYKKRPPSSKNVNRGLSTTIFYIPIVVNGRLTIAFLSCDILRSNFASSESVSYRVQHHRRTLTFASIFYTVLLHTDHSSTLMLESKSIYMQVLLHLHNSKTAFKKK